MALTPIAAPGPYVGGMTMTLTITFGNTGGTSATVDATIDDGAYTGLTLTANPAAVAVAAGGTNTQAFSVPILAGATTAAVTITALWTGTEAISSRAMNGGPNTVNVNIQSQAVVSVETVSLNSTSGPNGRWIMATVSVRNTGGTAVTGGSVVLTFNATAAITQVAINSTGITLAAGGLVYAQVKFQIPLAEPIGNTIRVDATFSGTEQYSARSVVDTTAVTPGLVLVAGSTVFVYHVIVGGRTSYIHGETFVIRATVDNSVGITTVTGGALSLNFGGATGFSSNSTTVPDPIAIGQVVVRDFLVTIAGGAAASCNLRAHFTGSNPLPITLDSAVTSISTYAPAIVAIQSAVLTPIAAPGPYVAGMTFNMTVTFQNWTMVPTRASRLVTLQPWWSALRALPRKCSW
jgi:hypothetical protein